MIACRHLASRRGGEKAVRRRVRLAQLHPAPRQRGEGTARRAGEGRRPRSVLCTADRPLTRSHCARGPARVRWGRSENRISFPRRDFFRRCGFSDLGSSTFSIDRGALASSFRSREREKGSGTPVDADPYPPHPAVRLCLPLGKQLACRRSTRGSRQRDFRPQGSASGHASWDAAGACDPLTALPGEERTPLHGRYPRRACPSPVKHLTRRS